MHIEENNQHEDKIAISLVSPFINECKDDDVYFNPAIFGNANEVDLFHCYL